MYDSGLAPTDGSEGARRGVARAIDLASEHDARRHLLFVVDERVHGTTPALGSGELFLEAVTGRGEAVLAEAATEAQAVGVETVTTCVRGTPAEAIVEYAAAHDVDLVVGSCHGTGERCRPHVGSSTDRVLRGTPVPVVPV